jgi:hypothetical protein
MAGLWPSKFQKFLEVVTLTRQKYEDDILETNIEDQERLYTWIDEDEPLTEYTAVDLKQLFSYIDFSKDNHDKDPLEQCFLTFICHIPLSGRNNSRVPLSKKNINNVHFLPLWF